MRTRKKVGQLCTRYKLNRTGCVGISYFSRTIRLAGGPVVRHFFQAYLGTRKRTFGIDFLGKDEAFRRAVQCRAEYELQVRREKEVNHA